MNLKMNCGWKYCFYWEIEIVVECMIILYTLIFNIKWRNTLGMITFGSTNQIHAVTKNYTDAGICLNDITIDDISQNEIMKFVASQKSDEYLFAFIKTNNDSVGIYELYKNELKTRYESDTITENLKLELLLLFGE